MTHSEIKKKFQIEYDKDADAISSYPSLTDTEIATILDKAYLALIAQKLTGNNPRRVGFEGDAKAVEDLRPLIKTQAVAQADKIDDLVNNEKCFTLPNELLYFLQATVTMDGKTHTVDLISHEHAKQFFVTESNLPWIKNAVAFIEGNKIAILFDSFKHDSVESIRVTYIKHPDSFAGFTGQFELSDTMAEELINLAIIMALENVESQRLTTKVQTRPLEA